MCLGKTFCYYHLYTSLSRSRVFVLVVWWRSPFRIIQAHPEKVDPLFFNTLTNFLQSFCHELERLFYFPLIVQRFYGIIQPYGTVVKAPAFKKMVDGLLSLRRALCPSERNRLYGFGKEGLRMLTIEGFIAVISLCVGCFSLGYVIGRNSKTQK